MCKIFFADIINRRAIQVITYMNENDEEERKAGGYEEKEGGDSRRTDYRQESQLRQACCLSQCCPKPTNWIWEQGRSQHDLRRKGHQHN